MSTVAIAKTAEAALLSRIDAQSDAIDSLATDALDAALQRLRRSGERLGRRLRQAELLMAAYLKAAADCLGDVAARIDVELNAPPPPEARAEARRDELVASRLEQLAASDRERHAGGGRTSRVGALVVLEEGASEPGTLSRASEDRAKAIAPEREPSAVVVADDPEADLPPPPLNYERIDASRDAFRAGRCEEPAAILARLATGGPLTAEDAPPPLAPERIARALDAPPAAGEMSDDELNALATRVGWPQPVAEPPPAANGKAKGGAKAKRRKK